MEDNGLATDEFAINIDNDYYDDFKKYEDELYLKFCRLWNSNKRPTAVILDSQNLAMGFINVFKKLDISIPDDLSLITYDDIPEYSVYPVRLTTVSPSLKEISTKIIERYEEYFNDGVEDTVSLKIIPELTKRESVRNINKLKKQER